MSTNDERSQSPIDHAELASELPESHKPGWPGLWVLVGGLATSVATLWLHGLLAHNGFDIMGFYVWFIVPVGAIAVGAAAGSGYGITSWLSNSRIGAKLLAIVVVLQIASYLWARHQEFVLVCQENNLQPGVDMTFVEYFDIATRNIAFTDKGGKAGPALGVWGYGIRLLEVIGFTLGGLIVPSVLMSAPFCESCGVYMKKRTLGWLPGGIEPRKIKKKETEAQLAYEQETHAAVASGQARIVELRESLSQQDSAFLHSALEEFRAQQKQINKQHVRYRVNLEHCPRCGEGVVVVATCAGFGKEQKEVASERMPVGSEIVDRLVD